MALSLFRDVCAVDNWRQTRCASAAGAAPNRGRYRADPAIAACDGDAHEAVKALIVANHFLETEFEKLRAAASRAMRVANCCREIGRIGMTNASSDTKDTRQSPPRPLRRK